MNSTKDINANSWEKEVLEPEILVVVDFWHDHCPWCLMLDPIYNEVSEEYEKKAKFVKFNVLESTENQQIAVKYGVMGTPTIIFFCEGRPVESVAGFQQKERLFELVEDVLSKHRECIEKSTILKTD